MSRWHNVQVVVEIMVEEKDYDDSFVQDIPNSIVDEAKQLVKDCIWKNTWCVVTTGRVVASRVEQVILRYTIVGATY